MSLRDPFTRAALVLLAVAIAGAVVLGLAWRGSAATLDVSIQMPFFVSGAVAGVGLIGVGIGLLSVHLDRLDAAEEQAILDDMVHDAAEIAEAFQRR